MQNEDECAPLAHGVVYSLGHRNNGFCTRHRRLYGPEEFLPPTTFVPVRKTLQPRVVGWRLGNDGCGWHVQHG